LPSDKCHPQQEHKLYRTLTEADTKGLGTEVSSCDVDQRFNVFRHILSIVSDLLKPDLLHTMHIGRIDHLQKWTFHFMKTHALLDKYNAILLSVPAYHDLTPNNSSYEEIYPWNGNEMKEMC
jgi:hypothetical protein